MYYNLLIQNEEYFIKDYIKLHKNLTDTEISDYMQLQFKRFGK